MSEETIVSFRMEVKENNFQMELKGKQSDVLAAFLYAMAEEPGLYQLMKMASSIYESDDYKNEFNKQQTKGDA
jgi:hypothetical protein